MHKGSHNAPHDEFHDESHNTPPSATQATPASGLEARLEDLEVRLSLAGDQIDHLNLTVFRQQQQIEQLGKALIELRQQVRQGAGGLNGPRDLKEEIPPHY